MKLLFFAALLVTAAVDLREMKKGGERKRVVAVYALLMLLAAGIGVMTFYTDFRILGLLGYE